MSADSSTVIYICPTCSREILGSKYQKRKVHRLCIHCNPSTSTDIYEWDEDGQIWYHLYTLYSCPKCKSDIKSYVFLDEDELLYSCKQCDPSTSEYKYIWNGFYWGLDTTTICKHYV